MGHVRGSGHVGAVGRAAGPAVLGMRCRVDAAAGAAGALGLHPGAASCGVGRATTVRGAQRLLRKQDRVMATEPTVSVRPCEVPGDDPAALRMVLCCTACHRAWPAAATSWDELSSTGCPGCGGWTWIGELTAPALGVDGAR